MTAAQAVDKLMGSENGDVIPSRYG